MSITRKEVTNNEKKVPKKSSRKGKLIFGLKMVIEYMYIDIVGTYSY
jgi:hypothetical protein